MTALETLPTAVALVVAPCIVFVELFRVLPFTAELGKLHRNSTKSITVLRSNRISDHWKGMIIPHYARLILQSTCLLGLFLVSCCGTFAATYLVAGYFLKSDLAQSLNSFLRLDTQLSALLVGSFYAIARTKFSASSHSSTEDYSASSSLLHHVALNYRVIRELAFDLDCAFIREKTIPQQAPPPVFVTGLARGGTTILLEALYSTGLFTTLTYRNMPFVTAPYLWPRLSSHFYRSAEKKERAHGDRLQVNFDSPEAFEEVFWLTFSKEKYVQKNSLAFQGRDTELESRFRRYVNNILAVSSNEGMATRYLAKNNNNLLRIEVLKAAFPDAIILVPFRNPLDHARSLLTQHQRFCQIHRESPFVLNYMNWLGHHEFGEDIKCFEVDDRFQVPVQEQAQSLEFWLGYWTAVYAKLLTDHAQQLVFFNYDSLCRSPKLQFSKLATLLALEPDKLNKFADSILPARTSDHAPGIKPEILAKAQNIHQKLLSSAL